jgi:hypothetical protein
MLWGKPRAGPGCSEWMRPGTPPASSLANDSADREFRTMPEKKPLKGVGEKEERMYEHIKDEAKRDHRYGKRAEEVAARTVLKHHREEHHDKGE